MGVVRIQWLRPCAQHCSSSVDGFAVWQAHALLLLVARWQLQASALVPQCWVFCHKWHAHKQGPRIMAWTCNSSCWAATIGLEQVVIFENERCTDTA